jgi:hypothetical protein
MAARHFRPEAGGRSAFMNRAMPLRRFVDATGTGWEVFHVRWKSADQAVATALGAGWLSFVSLSEKRRSQHVPDGWAALPDAELERLCSTAQVVRSVREAGAAQEAHAVPDASDQSSRRARGPRVTPRSAPLGEKTDEPREPVLETENAIRSLARSAREKSIPVLDAVAQVKRELSDRGEPTTPEALKTARRWFIDAYYFG